MVGIRTREYYLNRYGLEEGNRRFKLKEESRVKKELRQTSGRSLVKDKLTEKDIINGNAVKCQACGIITTTLQWTHFKYKCIPEINTISEYISAYPHSSLKSEKLKSLGSQTYENMVELYGAEEGLVRWEQYCSKQAITNTFEYKQQKYGWSEEQFSDFNKSRAITEENLINRHGEDKGTKIWNNYCEAQRYTNSLEYYIEKYGESGEEEWLKYNNNKANSPGSISDLERSFVDDFETYVGVSFEYSYKTKQLGLVDPTPDQKRTYKYDLASDVHRIILELHGDYWHFNPLKYEADHYNKQLDCKASDKWQKDKIKKEIAESYGYTVYVVWESDYREKGTKVFEDFGFKRGHYAGT